MKISAWMPAALAALLLFLGSVFVVSEGQTAIVLNLGKVVRTGLEPGLHFKLPLVESARIFDRRLQILAAEPERYLTSEKKDVSVDFFATSSAGVPSKTICPWPITRQRSATSSAMVSFCSTSSTDRPRRLSSRRYWPTTPGAGEGAAARLRALRESRTVRVG